MYTTQRRGCASETHPLHPVPAKYRALPHTFQLYSTCPKPLEHSKLAAVS